MRRTTRWLTGLALLGLTTTSHAMLIGNLTDATNGGGFFGTVTLTDLAPNQVQVDANIADPVNMGLTKGDILGLWFDLGILPASPIVASGPNFISSIYSPGNVGNASFGGNNNLNGTGAPVWDLAVEVGLNGGAGGFNQMVTIVLSATGLSTNSFFQQRLGMRVQSIEGVAGFTAGSSKLIGSTFGTPPPPPMPVAEPGVLGLVLLSMGLMAGAVRRRRIR